jgi:hypothetical protein
MNEYAVPLDPTLLQYTSRLAARTLLKIGDLCWRLACRLLPANDPARAFAEGVTRLGARRTVIDAVLPSDRFRVTPKCVTVFGSASWLLADFLVSAVYGPLELLGFQPVGLLF